MPFMSRIEVLESRIAPAATLTATLVGTKLTITGTADAESGGFNNSFGAGQFDVNASSGTILIFNGESKGDGGSVSIFTPVTDVSVDLGGGADTLDVFGCTLPKSLTVKGGAGDDSIKLVGVTAGTIAIDAGEGGDTVRIEQQTHTTSLDVKLGEGDNTLEFNFGSFFIEKGVSIKGGSGKDTLSLSASSGTFRAGGDFTLDFGKGDAVVNLGTPISRPDLIDIGGKLSLTTGTHTGANTVQIVTVGLHVGGDLNLTSTGTGANSLTVDAFSGQVIGKTNVKSVGDSSDTFLLTGKDVQFFGATTLDLGGGSNSANLVPTNSLTFSAFGYKGGAGNDTVNFGGVGNRTFTGLADFKPGDGANNLVSDITLSFTSFASGLNYAGGKGSDAIDFHNSDLVVGAKGAKISTGDGGSNISLRPVSTLSVYGGVNLASGSGGTTAVVGATSATVRGGLIATFGDGANAFTLGGNLEIGGGLTVTEKGAGDDTIVLNSAILSVKGAVSLNGDAGLLTTTVIGNYRMGSLNFTTKAGGGLLDIQNGSGSVLGDFNYKGGAGPNSLITGKNGNGSPVLDFFGKVNITSGTATGTESFLFRDANVVGAFTAKLGATASNVQIDDATFLSTVTLDTGKGADTVAFQNAGFLGNVKFLVPFKITTGDGDDTVNFNNVAIPGILKTINSMTQLTLPKLLLDGGAGTDTLLAPNFALLDATGTPTLSVSASNLGSVNFETLT